MAKSVLDNMSTLHFSGDGMTWTDILSMMSDEAISKGWAKEGFKEAILTRESKYATGLPTTSGVGIAIPHADAEWANEPAMIAATLDHPVTFGMMGSEDETVEALFVFMLVITDPAAHINFLQAICGFIEDENLLKKMADSKDITELVDYLKASL